jgi:hypothetical protein
MTLVTIVPWPSLSISLAERDEARTSKLPWICPVSSLIDVSTLVSMTATTMPCPVAPAEYALEAWIWLRPGRLPLVNAEPRYSGVSKNEAGGGGGDGRAVFQQGNTHVVASVYGPREMSKKAKALAALADHPEWTDEQIAQAAGCHVKSLYRWKDYARARELLRHGSSHRQAGRLAGLLVHL